MCIHRRSDVGLDEDEQDRNRREPDHLQHRPALPDPPRAVGEEPCQGQDEEQLPELGRLEAEEAEVEPALRMVRDAARHQHEQHHADRADVDRPLEAAVVVGVDQQDDEQAHGAGGGVDALAQDVVARVPRDVALRDPGDRPEPVAEQPGDRGQQHPVETAQERAELDRVAPDRA